MITRSSVLLAAVSCGMLLSAAVIHPVHAFDMSGNWKGKWSCKGFDGEKYPDVEKNSTMVITQIGNTIRADIDGGFYCNGMAIPDSAKPDEKGEVLLISCGTDNVPMNTPEEIIRASVKTKPGTFKASFKGLSIYDDDNEVETCKYSHKRVNQDPTNVPPCP